MSWWKEDEGKKKKHFHNFLSSYMDTFYFDFTVTSLPFFFLLPINKPIYPLVPSIKGSDDVQAQIVALQKPYKHE